MTTVGLGYVVHSLDAVADGAVLVRRKRTLPLTSADTPA